jgi:hypothetical protein
MREASFQAQRESSERDLLDDRLRHTIQYVEAAEDALHLVDVEANDDE